MWMEIPGWPSKPCKVGSFTFKLGSYWSAREHLRVTRNYKWGCSRMPVVCTCSQLGLSSSTRCSTNAASIHGTLGATCGVMQKFVHAWSLQHVHQTSVGRKKRNSMNHCTSTQIRRFSTSSTHAYDAKQCKAKNRGI